MGQKSGPVNGLRYAAATLITNYQGECGLELGK
jgi:hypothetical protein